MKWIEFLKEKIWNLLLLGFVIFTIEIFLMLYEVGIFIKIYIPIVILVGYFLTLVIEFFRKKFFYQEIQKKIELLDKKYLVQEIIQTPDFIEGKLLKEILQISEKSMIENVNRYKNINREYEEYIELWIHEIKTPIATSKMIIENNRNEITQNIEEEIDKIDSFVEQALYYARSNNVEKDYLIKKVNLEKVINEVIMKNKKELLEHKIHVNMDVKEQEVYSDSKWLVYIINQIMNNSIKYHKKQNPCIDLCIKEQKDRIDLYIKDNGMGIAKTDLERVFEKGFTGENGRKQNKATGMGLYLCKRLCDRLGHTIQVYSEENEQTEVVIGFPKGSFTNL